MLQKLDNRIHVQNFCSVTETETKLPLHITPPALVQEVDGTVLLKSEHSCTTTTVPRDKSRSVNDTSTGHAAKLTFT